MKALIPLFCLFFTACAGSSFDGKTIIAHRGASGYLPEHTLESVAMAHAFNPDFIEPDIVFTKDQKAIVLHDIHLEGNTNVEEIFPKRKRKDGKWYVIDFTLEEIKTLSVHERAQGEKPVFGKRFPYKKSSFVVPTLEEYIELVQGLNKSRGKNIGIYPEIKSPAFYEKSGIDAFGLTMNILTKYGYNKKGAPIFLQCFDPDYLIAFKNRFPNSPIPLVQLIADDSWGESSHNYAQMRTEEGLKKISTYAKGIGPWIPFVVKPNKETKQFEVTPLVGNAHKNGLLVHPYTLRKDTLPEIAGDAKSFLTFLFESAKIDGIFTDFPDVH